MIRTLCFAVLLTIVAGGVACSNNPNATADVEGDRAPLAGPSENTLNSPTVGPTSAGLSGGTESSESPELDPNRGIKVP